jgi:hypothetical protein
MNRPTPKWLLPQWLLRLIDFADSVQPSPELRMLDDFEKAGIRLHQTLHEMLFMSPEQLRCEIIGRFGPLERFTLDWMESVGAEQVPYPPGGKDAFTFEKPKRRTTRSEADYIRAYRKGREVRSSPDITRDLRWAWEALQRAKAAVDDGAFREEILNALGHAWPLALKGIESLGASIRERPKPKEARNRELHAAHQKFRRANPKGSIPKFLESSFLPSWAKDLDISTIQKILRSTRRRGT